MSETGTASTPLWIAGMTIAMGVVGAGLWFANQTQDPVTPAVQAVAIPQAPVNDTDTDADAVVSPEPVIDTVTSPAPAIDTDSDAVTSPAPEIASIQDPSPSVAEPIAPRLDEVRLDQGGLAVIAGRASPFSEVVLRADGIEIARTAANGRGSFATVALLEPSTDARLLTLAELDETGTERVSPDELILAPVRNTVSAPAIGRTLAAISPADAPDAATAGIADTAIAPSDRTLGPNLQSDVAQQPDVAQLPAGAAAKLPQPLDTPVLPASASADEKIAGQQQVAILRSGPDGVDLVQPLAPTPDVMSQVALDSISYSATGEVQLSGRAQSVAEQVRVYVDNKPVAALDVDDEGAWRGDVPDIDSGIYTLRIDEVTAEGTVSSRVETPFKREAADRLFAAVEEGKTPVQAITVQAGTTLWAIARERYGDGTLYVQVFEANKDAIRNPDLIYPGQVFELPE